MGRPAKYKNNWPSVTEIVDIIDKPGLRYWYGKHGTSECEKLKKASQKVGHGVHKGIEMFLEGRPFAEAAAALSNDQRVMLSYLTNWYSAKGIKVVTMEKSVYSKKYEFGGTPDLICTMGDDPALVLVDWKTDSVPREKAERREREAKYLWQLSGYAIAYLETEGVLIDRGFIVRASKDLRFDEVPITDIKTGMAEFKMLRKIFKRVRGR